MKQLLIAVLSLMLACGFTSCETRPVIIVELPKDDLLVDVPTALPLSLPDFMALDEEARESALFKLNTENIENLRMCNANKKALRQWKADMMTLIKQYQE